MTRQRLLTALTTAAVAMGFVLVAATPAAAHNYIVSSTPAADEVLTELPDEWVITTNENLLDLGGQGAGFAMVVTNDDGLYFGDSCVTVLGATLSMPAALGDTGDYLLTYQFVSADGHTLSGEFAFSWLAPADFEPHVGLDEVPVCGETESAPAPEPTETAQPEPSPEATADVEPIEPVADEFSPLAIMGIAAAVLAIAGVVAAAVLRARARRRAVEANGPEGTEG